MTGDLAFELPCPRRYDLVRTMRQVHHGPLDPTMRIARGLAWRATRTPEGPVTFRVGRLRGRDRLRVDAWGPGAGWVREHGAALVGLRDDPAAFLPEHPVLRPLARKFAGVHLPQAGVMLERLVPIIFGQLVTWREAMRALRGLVSGYGDDAPGPIALRMMPAAATLARLPEYAYAQWGGLAKQARAIQEAARHATMLEALLTLPFAEASAQLQRLRGIGPWTSAIALANATGYPDAVPLGDLHLPGTVGHALAREPEADDARMLELLEPFAGQRWRALQLIHAGNLGPPRRGPRQPMRRIAW